MSKVRNRTDGPRFVPLLDREVQAGEVVEVPDFQPAHDPDSAPGDPGHLPVIWPEETWEPVADPPPRPAAKTSAATGPAAADTNGKADG